MPIAHQVSKTWVTEQPGLGQSPAGKRFRHVTQWVLCCISFDPLKGTPVIRSALLFSLLVLATFAQTAIASEPARLSLKPNDRVTLIGNTLAERMQYHGHWETLLHARFPNHKLVVRNIGWSADAISTRLRSQDFQDHGHTLFDHKPNAIIAFFGFNESFAGPEGLPAFEKKLEAFIGDIRKLKYGSTTYARGSQTPKKQDGKGKVEQTPTIVLVSPIAHENLNRRSLPDGKANNKNIKLYADAMANVAAKNGALFVDLFAPTFSAMKKDKKPFTINGVHLNDYGYSQLAPMLDGGLFGPFPASVKADLQALRKEVNEKNLQFFYDHRAINGFYIYGGRKNPFGVVNFPGEVKKLRKMIARRDERIWTVARGEDASTKIDDSDTGTLDPIKTNIKFKVEITPSSEALKAFKLPKGYAINLFASEEDFPDLKNPVQFTFDAKGRLWVCTMASYPMYLPGVPVNDKILILEDTDGDGKADKQTVFADKLHLPTGIELGDGGAYVAQQPNLMFLKDTDGDDKADVRKLVLHGFDSADSHHSISAFEWGPGGSLYFQEGTFHHTQVETPYGPRRVKNAAVFRYEPRTEKFGVFISYGFANPWGHAFDRWGQNFVADASGGANYFGAAFSGQVDDPYKHPGLKQFLKKQWRPTSGCEIVASRNFPDDTQGDYLLNNVIGFHGVLRYRFKEDGSGFAADPVEPLLQSSNTNFRPVDLQFAPDGTLYLCDWFNPLVGHMQHSIRDPNRDTNHGRIWRIRYTDRKLVKPATIAGEPIAALLDQLKVYEDRTRFRARRELRLHDSEKVAVGVKKWIAGLDKKDEDYQHHLLEALWVSQHHDQVDEAFLKQLLSSPDARVRAAATRVLCYWQDRVEKPLELLRTQVNDNHPRVRLEAIRALSFVQGDKVPQALEVAVESLIYPQDDYLKYTLNETMATLNRRVKGD